MGFWSKLFGKKEENQPADDTMANPVATTDDSTDDSAVTPEENADVSEENAE